jgi:hypothetical protein
MKEQYTTNVSGSHYNVPVVPIHKRVSWGAIFAGVAIALTIQIVLGLLGVALGASSFDPLKEQNPGKGIGIGAAIWLVVSSLIAMFIGAWFAGRLSGGPRLDGRLHGLLTWSVATLMTVYLISTAAGNLLGGAAKLLGNVGVATAQSAKSGDLQGQLRQMGIDPDALKARAQAALPPGTPTPTGRTQYDPEQAAQSQADQARVEQRAREAGDTAARGVAHGAFWSFVLLALSAFAASLGGDRGARRFGWVEPVPAV